MSEITKAIAARQTRITQLQSEIATLQRAASIVGPPARAAAKPKPKQKASAKPRPKPKPKPKQKASAKPRPKPKPKAKLKATPKPKATQKRHQWSAAEKAAIGKRMKAYWAKRRKAKG